MKFWQVGLECQTNLMSKRISTEKLGVAQHRIDTKPNGQTLLKATSPYASHVTTHTFFHPTSSPLGTSVFCVLVSKLSKQECSLNLTYELSENGEQRKYPWGCDQIRKSWSIQATEHHAAIKKDDENLC